ncbi:hypothetical protein BDE02_01G043400 [Populus trichocarpa]|nr:hypothetical protein BDE02_01G043400 [Populus trichocarpa]
MSFMFRLDFHLVQLFFICLPSLGISSHVFHIAIYIFKCVLLLVLLLLSKRMHIRFCPFFLATAVYLVAQYARHEMKKMDAELEKKKKEEEEKAKEEELKAIEEKAQSESELLEVKERLSKLEEVVKEIAVESRKQSGGSVKKTQVQEDSSETLKPASTEASNRISESSKSVGKDHLSIQKCLEPAPVPDSSQKGKIQNEGTSPDAKR